MNGCSVPGVDRGAGDSRGDPVVLDSENEDEEQQQQQQQQKHQSRQRQQQKQNSSKAKDPLAASRARRKPSPATAEMRKQVKDQRQQSGGGEEEDYEQTTTALTAAVQQLSQMSGHGQQAQQKQRHLIAGDDGDSSNPHPRQPAASAATGAAAPKKRPRGRPPKNAANHQTGGASGGAAAASEKKGTGRNKAVLGSSCGGGRATGGSKNYNGSESGGGEGPIPSEGTLEYELLLGEKKETLLRNVKKYLLQQGLMVTGKDVRIAIEDQHKCNFLPFRKRFIKIVDACIQELVDSGQHTSSPPYDDDTNPPGGGGSSTGGGGGLGGRRGRPPAKRSRSVQQQQQRQLRQQSDGDTVVVAAKKRGAEGEGGDREERGGKDDDNHGHHKRNRKKQQSLGVSSSSQGYSWRRRRKKARLTYSVPWTCPHGYTNAETNCLMCIVRCRSTEKIDRATLKRLEKELGEEVVQAMLKVEPPPAPLTTAAELQHDPSLEHYYACSSGSSGGDGWDGAAGGVVFLDRIGLYSNMTRAITADTQTSSSGVLGGGDTIMKGASSATAAEGGEDVEMGGSEKKVGVKRQSDPFIDLSSSCKEDKKTGDDDDDFKVATEVKEQSNPFPSFVQHLLQIPPPVCLNPSLLELKSPVLHTGVPPGLQPCVPPQRAHTTPAAATAVKNTVGSKIVMGTPPSEETKGTQNSTGGGGASTMMHLQKQPFPPQVGSLSRHLTESMKRRVGSSAAVVLSRLMDKFNAAAPTSTKVNPNSVEIGQAGQGAAAAPSSSYTPSQKTVAGHLLELLDMERGSRKKHQQQNKGGDSTEVVEWEEDGHIHAPSAASKVKVEPDEVLRVLAWALQN